MSAEYLDYVEDILAAMEHAQGFVAGISYAQFEDDLRTNYAVVRALELIGEATKRLPMDVRARYPDIPWKAMAGMRDRVIHGYDTVDLQIVWDVVMKDIPRIKSGIRQILADHGELR